MTYDPEPQDRMAAIAFILGWILGLICALGIHEWVKQ